jgi:hypothetical protein
VARETLIKEQCGPRTKIVAHPWCRSITNFRLLYVKGFEVNYFAKGQMKYDLLGI